MRLFEGRLRPSYRERLFDQKVAGLRKRRDHPVAARDTQGNAIRHLEPRLLTRFLSRTHEFAGKALAEQIGALDTKSRIAPVTRAGRPILITLAATPELTTPFSPWPSFDGGERCSIDFRIAPELERLAAHIDEVVQRTVQASPTTWYSKVPKNIENLYNSCRRAASKEGYSGKPSREERLIQGLGSQ